MYIWCALRGGSYMFHQRDVHSMWPEFAYNVHSKYISMASLMHIVLIAMYVQCSMNAHTSYILFPYECTLHAHFNVHWFFATLHLKYWFMYI